MVLEGIVILSLMIIAMGTGYFMKKDVSKKQIKRFESGNIKCNPTNAEPPPPPSEQYGTNEGAEEACIKIGEALQGANSNKSTVKKLKIIENELRKIENGIIKLNRKLIKNKKMGEIAEKDIFSARWGIKNLINQLETNNK